MAKLTILGSGSRGNCIIIDNEGRKLLVECGVPYRQILSSTNYKISDWVAALCSHRPTFRPFNEFGLLYQKINPLLRQSRRL